MVASEPNQNHAQGDPTDAWSARVARGTEEYREHEGRLLEAVERAGFTPASQFAIRLAFEEAMMNAFKHGGGDAGGVDLEVRVTPEAIAISVDDHGPGFDPEKAPDPLAEENIELPSGRGLMLMRQYMTEVTHNERGNRVSLLYRRPSS